MSKSNEIYIRYDKINNIFYSYGIEFKEFYLIFNKPSKILLLDNKFKHLKNIYTFKENIY